MRNPDIEIQLNLDGLLQPMKELLLEISEAADEVARLVAIVAEKASGVDAETADLTRATEHLLLAIKGPEEPDDDQQPGAS